MRAIVVDRDSRHGRARRVPQLSAASLVLASIGLLSFAAGMVFWLEHAWDMCALWCVVGYVFCALAFCAPAPHRARAGDDASAKQRRDFSARTPAWWFASALNSLGLALGIVGSAMYSPTFVSWVRGEGVLVESDEFELLTDYSNAVWAASFLCFPLASALTLRDKILAQQRTRGEMERRSVIVRVFRDPELSVHAWIFVSLCVFAVGGFMFCLDEDEDAVRVALALFCVGGGIKLVLMANELFLFCTCSSASGVLSSDDEESPTEASPLLSPDTASETSSLLGDA